MEETIIKNTHSKKSLRKSNLITLISESEGKKIESKQEYVVNKYKKRFPDDSSFNQSALSKLLKDKNTFFINDGYLRVRDYEKRIDEIKKVFESHAVKVRYIEHYSLKTNGKAEEVLSILKKNYRSQILDASIIGTTINLSISYMIDYSNFDPKEVNGEDLESVLQYLDYVLNENK